MITNERLAELQREAEVGTLTIGGGRGISGKEVIELINVYREHRADAVFDFGELKGGSVSGDAFLGGMFGSLAGAMIDRKLRELPQGGNPPPPPMTEPERRAYLAKLKKNAKRAKGAKARKGSSRT